MRAVLEALLGPVARLAVAGGVPFATLSDLLKRAMLGAAERAAGVPATDSRLSLMTGLQRRDIARLRATAAPAEAPPAPHLARLVGLWLGDPAYAGRPVARKGPAPSFDDLARRVRKDIHARAMLDQLVAAGTVAAEGGTVRLLEDSYRPGQGSADQLAYLAANGQDFLSAAIDNVLGEGARHFERAVHYNHLSAEAIAELATLFADRQAALLVEINAHAARLQRTRPGQGRFRAGGYFYDTEDS
jgi:hypothetical protein